MNLKEAIYDASAFYSQQAAEVDAPVKISELCEKLTQHYIATRYPTDAEYSKTDAEEALDQSRDVIEWVKKRL